MKNKLLVLFSAVLLIFAFAWFKPFYVVPILNYHSVSPVAHTETPTISPEVFSRQMEYIHKKGYKVISLDEYIKQRKTGRDFKNEVVITFDDGYEDNYTYALPLLKRYHFPATIFLIVKDIDKARFLKLSQIKEMAKGNIGFGSHTLTHSYLPAVIAEDELKKQIFDSKKLLEKKLGKPVDYFCYPLGGFTEDIKKLVESAGYRAAFTTNKGPGKLNIDLYGLKRIKITPKTLPGFMMWFKLSGYYLLFQIERNSY